MTGDQYQAAGQIEYDSEAAVSLRGRMTARVEEINAEAQSAQAERLAGWWGTRAEAETTEPEAEP